MQKIILHLLILISLTALPCCKTAKQTSQNNAPETKYVVDLSPTKWGEGVLGQFVQMDNRAFPDNPMAIGKQGAVSTTFHAAASRAGLEALQQGGSSVDAALTSALTQVALNAGAVISYFGIMTMVHYDAASGEIVSMDATWNSVQNEKDPMSIPGKIDYNDKFKVGPPSGRTALVGGFMKGVEAAHGRYGKLPFGELFKPAIHLAEQGFIMSEATANMFERRDEVIRRLPETKATLVKPDGSSYVAGDMFKQAALANTLKRIAEEGADYMYKGEWGQKAINAVQAEGGKMTMKDLEDYEVMWNTPMRSQYGEYEVAVLGAPCFGSVNLLEALNLAYAADIPKTGHWSESGESLRKLSDITNMYTLSYLTPQIQKMVYPGLDLSAESRIKKGTTLKLWERMQQGVSLTQYADPKPKHSDTVVAIDKDGNMTAITHTINCIVWGSTGIMVDGISIGDAASFQQQFLTQIQPGERLGSPIEVGIVSKNKVPILPFASMSMGLHQQTVQSVLNVIAFDMNVKEAVDAPCIFLPKTDASNPLAPKSTVQVMEGAFPQEVLQSSGLPILELPASARRYNQGLWIGIYRNPETGVLQACSPPYATGRALAY